MKSLRRFILDLVIFIAIIATIFYLYRVYSEDVIRYFFGEPIETILIEDITLNVTIADEPAERTLGLSGVPELKEFEGKLFIFDEEGRYGMWMKDMLFPIDIMWINNMFEIVHIEKNVSPYTYPATYTSATPARFVLETNAYFTDTFKIEVGDRLTIPPVNLPVDLRE